MCGIFGIVGPRAAEIPQLDVDSILHALAHRGPDGRGVARGPGFLFGHTRLSIIDLSTAGAQPMWDAARNCCITFNGEIYNFRELRLELARLGARFRTHTDTEVILEAYKAWGTECLNRLEGMFAFALYDVEARRCFMARDRIGIKPLYYAALGRDLIFCSEPKGILRLPWYRPRWNVAAMSVFLSYRHTFVDDSLFRDIRLLPAGTRLIADESGTRSSSYWDVSAFPRESRQPSRGSVQLFREIFDASVKRHLVSDVPIGAFVSGGLDSSMIVSSVRRQSGGPLNCYSARTPHPGYDESHHAQALAAHCSVPLEIVDASADSSLPMLDAILKAKDLPLAMHNELAMYLLARAARHNVKVALSGEGADELAAGYGRLARLPFEATRLMHTAEAARLAVRSDGERSALATLKMFLDRYSYFPTTEKLDLFRKELRDEAAYGDERARQIIQSAWNLPDGQSPLCRLSYVLLKIHLPGLLQMVDAATMAASLELRVPFTDHHLVEHVFSLPDTLKLRWRFPGAAWLARFSPNQAYSERLDETKCVYRRAFRHDLPRAILTRRKEGFPVPLGAWCHGPWRAAVDAALDHAHSPLWEVFDRHRVQGWYQRGAAHTSDTAGKQIWMLMNLARWMGAYFAGGSQHHEGYDAAARYSPLRIGEAH